MEKEAPRRRGLDPRLANEVIETPVPRAEMRSDMREVSSLERARLRAAELRGQIEVSSDGADEFPVPQAEEGWTYEWKRKALLGQEDHLHMVELRQVGWMPVPTYKHPEYMPTGWEPEAPIERKGMILMERPTEIVEEFRRRNDMAARKQVRDKEAQIAGTPDGTMTRDHAQVRPQIKKGYEAIPIPSDK